MNTFTILIIGIGLAMDCFAVSFSGGLYNRYMKLKDSLKIAFAFGFFQFAMPIIGWAMGASLKKYIVVYDHWIAFSVLSFVGLKMIIDAIQHKSKEKKNVITNWKVLLSLSVVTSIDALIVGISFAFLNLNIIKTSLIIGAISFIISYIGLYFGKKSSRLFTGSKAEIVGGLFLILIGCKILFDHLILNN